MSRSHQNIFRREFVCFFFEEHFDQTIHFQFFNRSRINPLQKVSSKDPEVVLTFYGLVSRLPARHHTTTSTCLTHWLTFSFASSADMFHDLPIFLSTIRTECKILVVELNTDDSATAFSQFLQGPGEVDPVVLITFGPPIAPFGTPASQTEILNILNSYQPLLKADFAPGAVIQWRPLPATGAPLGGFQFHHAQIALQRVQQEIENPSIFAAQCPSILGIGPAQNLCDFQILYSNCVVARRLRRLEFGIDTKIENKFIWTSNGPF